jgi:hypothetical protein
MSEFGEIIQPPETIPPENLPAFAEDKAVPPTCPSCHAPVSADASFCPRCGAKLKEPPLSTSAGRLTFIYLFSFFLAPLGLGYAVKYLRQWKNPKTRTVGIVVVVLTILAIIIMIWASSAFTNWEYQTINSF